MIHTITKLYVILLLIKFLTRLEVRIEIGGPIIVGLRCKHEPPLRRHHTRGLAYRRGLWDRAYLYNNDDPAGCTHGRVEFPAFWHSLVFRA